MRRDQETPAEAWGGPGRSSCIATAVQSISAGESNMQWPEKNGLQATEEEISQGGGAGAVHSVKLKMWGTKIGAEAWSLRQATRTSREQPTAMVGDRRQMAELRNEGEYGDDECAIETVLPRKWIVQERPRLRALSKS